MEFPFPTFSKDSFVNSFQTWVRNTAFYLNSQSKKLEAQFFNPTPIPIFGNPVFHSHSQSKFLIKYMGNFIGK